MADEQKGVANQIEANLEETPIEETIPQQDSPTEGITSEEPEVEETTKDSAITRTKEQIQESERYQQGVNTKLRETISDLKLRLGQFQTEKPSVAKSEKDEGKSTESSEDEEFIGSAVQVKKIVGDVFREEMGSLRSIATLEQQTRTVSDAFLDFKSENNIPDEVFNGVMKEYGPIVKREIEARGNVTGAAEMFLETLANRAGLERDAQVVETAKVQAARKGKALEQVQQPTISGGAPTIEAKTEDDKLIEELQSANKDIRFKKLFES